MLLKKADIQFNYELRQAVQFESKISTGKAQTKRPVAPHLTNFIMKMKFSCLSHRQSLTLR